MTDDFIHRSDTTTLPLAVASYVFRVFVVRIGILRRYMRDLRAKKQLQSMCEGCRERGKNERVR